MYGKPTALVVESRRWMGDRLAEPLEAAGLDVLLCPGPTTPDYTCSGTTAAGCVLARVADVVVLDLRLAGDEWGRGTPAFELLWVYGGLGKPLVLLAGERDPVVPFPGPQVHVLGRLPRPAEVVNAVHAALSEAGFRRWSPNVAPTQAPHVP